MKIAFIDVFGKPYDGNTLNERGLGGSEASVIYLSRELAKQGQDVVVFCDTDITEEIDGVEYTPLSYVEKHKDYDVVIVLRSVCPFTPGKFNRGLDLPDFFQILYTAKYKAIWRHDLWAGGDEVIKELLEEGTLNEVYNLSDFHTAVFKAHSSIDDKYLWQTRNGYHHYSSGNCKKDPNKFIFNSAAYKGLPLLLEIIWPKVKAHIPEAKLTVVGGYYEGSPDANKQYINDWMSKEELIYKATELDITFTGIITPEKVAEEVGSSTYMIYPPTAPETFGISVLEAIAYETIPITSGLGALETTAIDEACFKCPLDPMEYPDAFLLTVLNAWYADLIPKRLACEQVWRTCSWKNVAEEWLAHYEEVFSAPISKNEKTFTKNKNVLIGIPTAIRIESETFKSIYDLTIPEGYSAHFNFFACYLIDQGKNTLADYAIRCGFDYVLCVDNDIELPQDTLVKLLAHDKDVVCGMYRKRQEDQKIEIYDTETSYASWDTLSKGDLVEIESCGFGCVLIKTKVFKEIGYPQFFYHQACDPKDAINEDKDFCKKVKDKGFNIYCDTSIKCCHKGTVMWKIQL